MVYSEWFIYIYFWRLQEPTKLQPSWWADGSKI
nr:MAG TPA: hypothetical protein [Caudoviricetes sp.]